MSDVEVTEAKVTYTTKELLRSIDERFGRLEALVTNQPTRGEFDLVVSRLTLIEDEQIAVRAVAKALADDKTSRFSRNDKIVGLGIAAALLVLNILTLGPDLFTL